VNVRGGRSTWKQGSDDGFTQAVELVVTPLLFGALGWFLDARYATGPAFTVALALLGVVGASITQYYRYVARIARDDEGKPWTRRQR
jgi:F0F1-type ATP synthase assembly protein I